MSCDGDGRLHDPIGGRADLAAGRVRFVGDARRRIAEDYLRILRFFRFRARFGRGAPDAEALAACAELAAGIDRLSGERVRQELWLILAGPRPAPALALMADDGRAGASRCPARWRRRASTGWPSPTRSCGSRPWSARRRRRAPTPWPTGSSSRTTSGSASWHSPARLFPTSRPGRRRNGWRRTGWAPASTATSCSSPRPRAWSTGRRRGGSNSWAATWRAPEFPLGGADLLALGVPPGPGLGRILAQVRREWEEGDFRLDRAGCLARAGTLAGAATPRHLTP